MKQFYRVILEISNVCSAKCEFCSTGMNNGKVPGIHSEKFISPDVFEKIVKKLDEHDVFAPESNRCINVLNWGEPFLHPQFPELVEIMKKYNLNYAISTNGSKPPMITDALVENMLSCRISMPGFSQASYDKIHKLQFEKIKNNIEYLAREIQIRNPKTVMTIAYHVYQFNCINEINEAALFAKKNNIRFSPVSAYIADFDTALEYSSGTISKEKLLKLSAELFLGHLDYKPREYCSMWDNFLVLNTQGDVTLCCSVHNGHEGILLGNIIKDDYQDILVEKAKSKERAICHKCLSAGLADADVTVWPQANLNNIESSKYTGFLER